MKEAGWIVVGIVMFLIIGFAAEAGNNALLIGLALLLIVCAVISKKTKGDEDDEQK